MKPFDPLEYAQQMSVRAAIIFAEKRLMKARYRRRPVSPGEKRTTLSIKAMHLGASNHGLPNPFEGWNHEMAAELAKSFQQGQGS